MNRLRTPRSAATLLLTPLFTASLATSLLAAGAAGAAAPVSRSGSAAAAQHLPALPLTMASPPGCADAVFANGLDDAARGVCDNGAVTVYTDRAEFLAALAAGHIENAFTDVAPGTSLPLQYADGGFNY
ncbi:MAG: hypothetical protein ABW187_02170, partial [Dokdonella sp.]